MEAKIKKILKDSDILIWIFVAIYIAVFFAASFLKYISYEHNDYDLAIQNQALYKLLHGSLYNTIREINIFADHFSPILFFILPLYYLFKSPLVLLFVQALALGLGAFLVYLISKSLLNKNLSLILGVIYLLHPAVGYANLFEFHFNSFLPLLFLAAFYYFQKDRFFSFILSLFVAMLCMENAALGVLAFGIYAACKRKSPKWYIWPCMLGILWFWFTVGIVMPFLNKGEYVYFGIYRHLGGSFLEIAVNLISHPIRALTLFFTGRSLKFLFSLFSPLAFIPLLSPAFLLVGAPFFLQHLLSIRPMEQSIAYHYASDMVPFIFIAYILSIAKLQRLKFIQREKDLFITAILGMAIFWNAIIGPQVYLPHQFFVWRKKPLDYYKDKMLKEIPSNASVIATFEFLPRLSNRNDIYSFHHLYKGTYSLSEKPYEVSPSLEYTLINFDDKFAFTSFYTPLGPGRIRKFLKNGNWGLIDTVESIALFKKDYKSDIELCRNALLKDIDNKANFLLADGIELLGFTNMEKEALKPGERMKIRTFWRVDSDKLFDRYYLRLLTITRYGRDAASFVNMQPLFYGIIPMASEFKTKEILEEDYWLLLPQDIIDGEYILRMKVAKNVRDAQRLIYSKSNWIDLGIFRIRTEENQR